VRLAYFRTAYFSPGHFKAGFMAALSDGLTVGVDLGGTKIAAGVVDRAGEIVSAAHVPTPRDPELILGAVIDAVRQIRNGRGDVQAIGIGAAGYVDEQRSTVHFGPNLSWRNQPIRALVEQATQLRVVVENDANAAAWGEFVHGGLSETGELIRRPAERAYRQVLGAAGHRAQADVRTAAVGRHAGLLGAADLARRADHNNHERR
jgi:predicted NBD/HSP70 family sugar kinase